MLKNGDYFTIAILSGFQPTIINVERVPIIRAIGLVLLSGGAAPKVIFCTVENEIERIREALDAGADEFIMKPFDGGIVAGKLSYLGLAA